MINQNPDDSERFFAKICEIKYKCFSIEDSINKTEPTVLSEILAQKYLCGKSLEEIAEVLLYSKRQTERLHRKALESIKILT